MAKHAFAAYVISINARGRPADRIPLGNLNGSDLLHLIHGLLKDVENKHVRAEKSQHVLTVEDVAPGGRAVKFKTQYGRFGLRGRIINAETAEVTHEYGDAESPVSPTRNVFVIPEDREHGLFIAERYGGNGAATMVKSTLTRALRARFSDDFTLHVEAVHDRPAWLAYVRRADMKELNINRYRLSSDRADRTLVDVIGKEGRVFKPKRGTSFPDAVKNQILERRVRAHDLVGVEFSDEDEVVVTLDDKNQKKQIVVSQIEPPALVYQVADDTADRPNDAQFYRAATAQIPNIATESRIALPSDWETGEWSEEQKGVKLRAHRDE